MAKKNGKSKDPKKDADIKEAVVIEEGHHNADFTKNHELIKEAIIQCIQGSLKQQELPNEDDDTFVDALVKQHQDQISQAHVPTVGELAQMTGLSTRTVIRHYREMRFEPTEHPLKILNDDVLLNIYKLSKTQVRAAELWAMLFMNFNRSLNVNVKGQVIHKVEFELKGSKSNLLDGLR